MAVFDIGSYDIVDPVKRALELPMARQVLRAGADILVAVFSATA